MNKAPFAPVSILLIDERPGTRPGLARAIENEPRFLLASATRGEGGNALPEERFEVLQPDIVLLGQPDNRQADVVTARRIRSMARHAHVVVLTSLGREEDIFRGLKAGARGYLLHDAAPEQVLECLRTVAGGRRYVSPFVAGKLAARLRHDALSDPELEILQMMAEGRSAAEIAQRALLSEGNVAVHINSILFKISAGAYGARPGVVPRRTHGSMH